jgi:hypothetical protein
VVVRSSVNKGTQFFEAGERTKCFQVITSQHSPTLALTYFLQLYLRTAQRLVARRAGGKWRKQLEKVLRESCDQGAEKGAEHLRKQFDLMVVSADLVPRPTETPSPSRNCRPLGLGSASPAPPPPAHRH